MQKIIIISLRFLLGSLFIFSGLIKANDPLGLSYKMDEFYEVLHLPFLSNFSLLIAIFLITAEVLLGLALLTGIFAQITTRTILGLNLFFLFLTAYATFSGKIKTCGCFGDCLRIDAHTSFIKDIILTIISAVLVLNYTKISPFLSVKKTLRINTIGLLIVPGICIISLSKLPFLDCLSFKINTNLSEKLAALHKNNPLEIWFYYTKNDKEFIFKNGNFPADFDETYTFIKREEHAIPNTTISDDLSLKDFQLFDTSGKEKTKAILKLDKCYLIFLRQFTPTEKHLQRKINALSNPDTIPVFFVAATHLDALKKLSIPHLLICDNVLIKTIARSKATLYYFEKGTIRQKKAI